MGIIVVVVVVVIVVVVETARSSSSSFVADSVAKQQIRDKMAASSVGCRSDIGGGGLMRQQRVFLIGCLLFSKKMKVVCGRFLLLLQMKTKKTNTLNTKRILYSLLI